MAQYVGVDYGTSMLKAAVTDRAGATPSLLRLEPPDPFMPAAVSTTTGERLVGSGAFMRRRRTEDQVACGFRDRVLAPESSVVVGGRAVSGQELQLELLKALSGRIQQAAGNEAASMAVAFPDHWSAANWSLPLAMSQAGWRPSLGVREWTAVLAMQDDLPSQEVLLLSLGTGAARATVCICREGVWRPLAQASDPEISGAVLRTRLLAHTCEEVIQQTRKDPREDDVADQTIHDAVETALRTLMVEPEAQVVAQLGGIKFSRALSRDDLAAQAAPLQVRLEQLIERLLSDGRVEIERCPILAWGELAFLLPIDDWLERFSSRRTSQAPLPLDVVAAGAARLCAAFAGEGSHWPSGCFGSVGADGAFSERLPDDPSSTFFPILQQLPGRLDCDTRRGNAVLVLVGPRGEGDRREISKTRFELGREPSSDWVFRFSEHPTVSGRHAAIVRDGEDYFLKELGSSNGTFLNGGEVRDQHVLKSGDVISLGQQGPQLRFEYKR